MRCARASRASRLICDTCTRSSTRTPPSGLIGRCTRKFDGYTVSGCQVVRPANTRLREKRNTAPARKNIPSESHWNTGGSVSDVLPISGLYQERHDGITRTAQRHRAVGSLSNSVRWRWATSSGADGHIVWPRGPPCRRRPSQPRVVGPVRSVSCWLMGQDQSDRTTPGRRGLRIELRGRRDPAPAAGQRNRRSGGLGDQHTRKVLDLTIRLAEVMLSSGSGTADVVATARDVAEAYQLTDCDRAGER